MMPSGNPTAEGGCHCGRVRYKVSGAPVYVPYCHCESCRRVSGAPVVMYVMFEKSQVRFSGEERKLYASSPDVRRGFCADCGTSLTWEGNWGHKDVVELYVCTLDEPEQFRPDRHAFYSERLNGFDIDDRLPRYNGSSTDVEPDCFGPSSRVGLD